METTKKKATWGEHSGNLDDMKSIPLQTWGKSRKEALQIGLARLKKDVELYSKMPNKEFPVEALQVTVDYLENELTAMT